MGAHGLAWLSLPDMLGPCGDAEALLRQVDLSQLRAACRENLHLQCRFKLYSTLQV